MSEKLVCKCGREFDKKFALTLHQKKCSSVNSDTSEPVIEATDETKPNKVEKKEEKVTLMIGSVIKIDGQCWWQEPVTLQWKTVKADKIEVEVISRMSNEQGVFVIAKTIGGQAVWAVLEDSGSYTVVNLQPKADVQPVVQPTQQEVKVDDDGKYLEELKKFRYSVDEFVTCRDRKLEAEKELKRVDKVHRHTIEAFAHQYGVESGEGKGDAVVYVDGNVVHMVRTVGKENVSYNVEMLVDWAVKNNVTDIIKTSIDIDKYEAMKKLGKIPSDIILAAEKVTKSEDKFSMTIKEKTIACKECGSDVPRHGVYDKNHMVVCPTCGCKFLLSE